MTTGRINQVNILLISSFFLWGSLSPPDDSESRTVHTKVQSDCIPLPPVVLGILRSPQFHPTPVWTNPSHIQVHTTRMPPGASQTHRDRQILQKKTITHPPQKQQTYFVLFKRIQLDRLNANTTYQCFHRQSVIHIPNKFSLQKLLS